LFKNEPAAGNLEMRQFGEKKTSGVTESGAYQHSQTSAVDNWLDQEMPPRVRNERHPKAVPMGALGA